MARNKRNVLSNKGIDHAIELAAVSATPALLETLERRQLLSSTLVGDKLLIEGTPGNDVVTLTLGGNGATIDVQEIGSLRQFSTATVKSIQISTGDGNDTITLSNQVITFTRPVFKQIKLPSAVIAGGSGNDTIQGGPSADTIYGDNKPLVILPPTTGRGDGGGVKGSALRLIDFDGTGDDQISGGAGNDTISGGNGQDTLAGEAGNDSLHGNAGFDVLEPNGGPGNDFVYGDSGEDTIFGGAAADGSDFLSGGNSPETDLLRTDILNLSARTVGMRLYVGQPGASGAPGEGDTIAADFELIYGGSGADHFIGTEGKDRVNTGHGNDLIEGRGGDDHLFGFFGNDTIYGGEGDDEIDGQDDSNLIDGGAGNDSLTAGFQRDIFIGGEGRDSVSYEYHTQDLELHIDGVAHSGASGENDRIDRDIEQVTGGRGNDKIYGTDNSETLIGGPGNDRLVAHGGNDLLEGGAGDDELLGGTGADTVDGGLGRDELHSNGLPNRGGPEDDSGDVLDYRNRTENLTINPNGQPVSGAAGEGDTISLGFEIITSGSGNDVIVGTDASETIYGNDGNDLIRGMGGDDMLVGGFNGSDTIDGGAGKDVLLSAPYGADAGDADVLEYSSRSENLLINLNGKPVSGAAGEEDTIYRGFEIIRSGSGNDTIVGTDLNEQFFGNGGNDLIDGGAGNDRVHGGAGNDALKGGSGNDLLEGNDGNDRLDGGRGNDVLRGGAGTDTANYSDRTDNLTLRVDGNAHSGAAGEKDTIHTDFEIIRAGSGNDRIFGTSRADTIFGGAGNDEIRGLGGNDRLDGGAGNDRLIGGDGNDILIGRAGRDTFYGQNGNDTFYADDRERDHLDGGAGSDRFRSDNVDRLISLEARL